MKTYEQYYVKVSNIYFGMHIFAIVCILIGSFLPFYGARNVYQTFGDYMGLQWMLYTMFFLIALLCLLAYFVKKKPLLSLLMPPISMTFFLFLLTPYALEVLLTFVDNPLPSNGELVDRNFGIGFDLMTSMAFISFFESVFVVYAIVISVKRRTDKKNEQKNSSPIRRKKKRWS